MDQRKPSTPSIFNKNLLLLIIPIVLLFTNKVTGQCLIEQLVADINDSSSDGNGQSFVACSSGLLNQFQFKTLSGWPGNFHPYQLKDSDCNVIWSGTVQVFKNKIITIDLSTGSGTTRNVISGETYELRVNSFYTFHISNSNSYLNGARVGNTLCNPNSGRDMWFRIAIGTTLPVDIKYFSFKINDQSVSLNWETSSETNNSGFEIQRSINGISWDKLNWVNGEGTIAAKSTYQYDDNHPSTGINYYRLKQIDFDGNYMYSDVIKAFFKGQGGIQILPNPVSENLYISGIQENEKSKMKIFDTAGRLVMNIQAQNQVNLSSLKNGLYFIDIGGVLQKLVKQ